MKAHLDFFLCHMEILPPSQPLPQSPSCSLLTVCWLSEGPDFIDIYSALCTHDILSTHSVIRPHPILTYVAQADFKLAKLPRLVWNSHSSCLSLWSAGITGMNYHAQPQLRFTCLILFMSKPRLSEAQHLAPGHTDCLGQFLSICYLAILFLHILPFGVSQHPNFPSPCSDTWFVWN
jgi:hypothetical protein